MNFHRTDVDGCYIIEPTPRGDHRGFFSRVFDAEIFAENGLASTFVQFNNSLSATAGTLRGLHYQVAPSGEVKLIRCVAGAVFDVVLDLRKNSRTFGRWTGTELSASNRLLLYAPAGCAHGFLTLINDTELIYFSDAPYVGSDERVCRWDDPHFKIVWPRAPTILSDKDRDAANYTSMTQSGY